MIKNWKPWERSTGAKTEAGKEASKMNAEKHGMRGAKMMELLKILKDQKNMLKKL